MAGRLNQETPSPFIPLSEVDPQRFSFMSQVSSRAVNPASLAALVPQVTTYREFARLPGMDNSRVEESAGTGKTLGDDWVYAFHQEAGEWHYFTFTAVRTKAEMQKPIPALSYVTVDLYPWPDVLLDLWFVEDPGMPIEVVVNGQHKLVPRLYERKNILRGGSFPTIFEVDVFASHKKFDQNFCDLDTPQPSGVYWHVRNLSGSISECLHDDVTIPESQENGRVWFGAGMKGSDPSFGTAMFFPKTNHLRWRDHVSHWHQQQVNGCWMLERRRALVPRGARKINRL